MVSRSSDEAEYLAITNTTYELLWLKALLRRIKAPQPIIMPCDNQATIHIALKSVFMKKLSTLKLIVISVRRWNLESNLLLTLRVLINFQTSSPKKLTPWCAIIFKESLACLILAMILLARSPYSFLPQYRFSLKWFFFILKFLMRWIFKVSSLNFCISTVKLEGECWNEQMLSTRSKWTL